MEVVFERSITAGICGGILLLVLVVLVILAIWPNSRDRVCGSIKKRLTIWLTGVTILAEVFQSLSLVYYFNTMDLLIPDSHNMAFCYFFHLDEAEGISDLYDLHKPPVSAAK